MTGGPASSADLGLWLDLEPGLIQRGRNRFQVVIKQVGVDVEHRNEELPAQ